MESGKPRFGEQRAARVWSRVSSAVRVPHLTRFAAAAVVLSAVALLGPRLTAFGQPAGPAQPIPPVIDQRFAGLQWTFARVRYNTYAGESRGGLRVGYWDEPWAIDAPAAEENLTRRLRSVTAVDVAEPVVVALDDEKIWQYPWLYIVEPSNLLLSDKDIAVLREHLMRGGTLTFDDFHGPYEWDLLAKQLKNLFPDREIIEIEPPHPIYTCFYKIDKYPQIPGLGSFFQGRTWEKGGFVPHLRGILDDTGRPMVLINWNTDIGDGMEWSNAEEYPGYVKWTALAYQMMINEVIYSLTH